MCLIALSYYPRQKGFGHCGRNFANPNCAATYTNRTLETIQETQRKFGSKADHCPVTEDINVEQVSKGGESNEIESGVQGSSNRSLLVVAVVAVASYWSAAL